jgi:hypothetical protein
MVVAPVFAFFIILSLSMSLTGLSLELFIFHFEAIPLSTHISGSKRPIPKMGLWFAPHLKIQNPKIQKEYGKLLKRLIIRFLAFLIARLLLTTNF